MIAHRGASAERPENTLSAYALAVEQGADWIEIDLHRTRDGAIVIAHDADLAVLGGQGAIADASLAEVRALDAGDGQRVPTLDEVLDGFAAKVAFNLELKSPDGPSLYPELERLALEAVLERGLLERVLFSSFRDDLLARLRGRSAEARMGLLISRRLPYRPLERAAALGAEALNPAASLVSAELVDAAHEAGLAVYPFTVDAADEIERMLDLGVDGLFTNVPARMRAIVDRRAG